MKFIMNRVALVVAITLMTIATTTAAGAITTSSSNTSMQDATKSLHPFVELLYKNVTASQWQETKPYGFPLDFGHLKGRFPNMIHLNFVGSPINQIMREDIGFPDDNGFVDLFVLESLYSAGYLFPEAAPLNDTTFAMAMETALENKDKYSSDDTPIFGFWPQKLIEFSKTLGPKYEQWSINLSQASADGTWLDAVLKALLKDLHLMSIYDIIFAPLQNMFTQMLTMFNIPIDSDDTGCTIALTRLLQESEDQLPKANSVWSSKKFNTSLAFEKIAKYAYCPGSHDPVKNSIDPRTYFWARDFFREHAKSGPDACLVTTWLTDYGEEVKVWDNQSYSPLMPFNVNNVDPTVAANALFGMTTSLLSKTEDKNWFHNKQIREVYLGTAKFVGWALQNQVNISRPDLEMLYYPPTVNLPMFVGRHVQYLESYLEKHGRQFPKEFSSALDFVYRTLRDSARDGGMVYLHKVATVDTKTNSQYWNGFLGMADMNDKNESTPHPLDRLYTSAVAINAMLDAWTFTGTSAAAKNASTPAAKLQWVPDTPVSTHGAAVRAARYLVAEIKKFENPNTAKDVSFSNTFFSGSIHSHNTFPWDYPMSSIYEMTTKKHYNCANFTGWYGVGDQTFMAMNGNAFSEKEYNHYLENGCGQFNATKKFVGFNDPMSPWPFWSSETLTKSLVMMALAKMHSLGLDQLVLA